MKQEGHDFRRIKCEGLASADGHDVQRKPSDLMDVKNEGVVVGLMDMMDWKEFYG
jgi:hypothetical protein